MEQRMEMYMNTSKTATIWLWEGYGRQGAVLRNTCYRI